MTGPKPQTQFISDWACFKSRWPDFTVYSLNCYRHCLQNNDYPNIRIALVILGKTKLQEVIKKFPTIKEWNLYHLPQELSVIFNTSLYSLSALNREYLSTYNAHGTRKEMHTTNCHQSVGADKLMNTCITYWFYERQ